MSDGRDRELQLRWETETAELLREAESLNLSGFLTSDDKFDY